MSLTEAVASRHHAVATGILCFFITLDRDIMRLSARRSAEKFPLFLKKNVYGYTKITKKIKYVIFSFFSFYFFPKFLTSSFNFIFYIIIYIEEYLLCVLEQSSLWLFTNI